MKLTGKAVTVVLLLVTAGCSKSESGTATDAAAPGALGKDAPTGALGSALGEAAGAQLAGTFSTQLQQHQGHLDTLEASAKQYADQKLNGLLSSLDQEVTAASAKVAELKSAGAQSAKAIQAELQGMMGDITDLLNQARSRLAELQAAKP